MIKVLTLNWNGEKLLEKMLPGLFNNLEQIQDDYQVYIRDNGSKDNSIDVIKQYDKIDILEIGNNRDNFAQGVNSLFERADVKDEDLILLLNNDIIFNDDISLKNMYNLLKKTNSAVCGARLMYDNGKISHNGVIFSAQRGNFPWHFREGEKVEDSDLYDRYFQAVTAACCFIRGENFRKAGLMDTKLSWAFEDVSLNLDISINQRKNIVCCGKTDITHSTSKSLNKNPINKLFLQNNIKRFKEKWWKNGNPIYNIDHNLYLKYKNHNVVQR